jgi:hypothetical protein
MICFLILKKTENNFIRTQSQDIEQIRADIATLKYELDNEKIRKMLDVTLRAESERLLVIEKLFKNIGRLVVSLVLVNSIILWLIGIFYRRSKVTHGRGQL